MKKKTKHIKLLKEFIVLGRDILHSPEFQRMKGYQSHVNSNLYDHSAKVAYLCYLHHRRWKTKIDAAEFVRGALLHDYYLYDLHGDGRAHTLHWFRHPRISLDNALAKYPGLSAAQKDMIRHHMFPLTLRPPGTRAGWLVCFYDKIAAVSDRFARKGGKRACRV